MRLIDTVKAWQKRGQGKSRTSLVRKLIWIRLANRLLVITGTVYCDLRVCVEES